MKNAKLWNIRVGPGEDLRYFLLAWCKSHRIQAASIVSSVGSLSQASLRLANAKEAVVLPGPFELLSVNGTLSEFGLHIHLALADGQGRALGGHLLEGNLVYTTCELVILEQTEVCFQRELDPQTGYPELVVKSHAPVVALKS